MNIKCKWSMCKRSNEQNEGEKREPKHNVIRFLFVLAPQQLLRLKIHQIFIHTKTHGHFSTGKFRNP